MVKTNKFFSCDQLFDNVYRIKGLGGALCYLVIGGERALLIDGLSGVGSLKEFAEGLTDLPITLAITHAHRDHSGAVWEFGECFMHPDDLPLLYVPRHSSNEMRFAFVADSEPVKQGIVTFEDLIPTKPIKAYPIYDGDVFDLGGGVYIDVVTVPGHSYGSLVFIDRGNRVAYTGDACNIMTLVGLYGCTTVEEYRDGLLNFKVHQQEFDVCYGGHGFYPVKNTVIDDALMLCEKILKGEDDQVEMHNLFADTAWLAAKRDEQHNLLYGGDANILYDKKNIWKRPHPMIKGKPNLYK